MLNATLHHLLSIYNTHLAENIKENIYVNNNISSCNQEQKAAAYYHEARSIVNDAHFVLRPWSSNSPSKPEKMTLLIHKLSLLEVETALRHSAYPRIRSKPHKNLQLNAKYHTYHPRCLISSDHKGETPHPRALQTTGGMGLATPQGAN